MPYIDSISEMASTHPRINPGRLVALVDYKWRTDRLPFEDIVVPIEDLPDPDADHGALGFGGAFVANGSSLPAGGRFQQHETLRDIERKWNDLALYRIHRGSPAGGNSFFPRTSSTNTTTRSTSTAPTGQPATTAGSSTAAGGSGQ